MKKFFATILAVIYLSTSMGMTVHFHYCMGKLFSWDLAGRPDKKGCSRCGMPKGSADRNSGIMKSGCCKDTQTVVKLDKDQKAAKSAYRFFNLSFDGVSGKFVNLPDRYVSSSIVDYPRTNAPPDPDLIPLFIRNRNFRI